MRPSVVARRALLVTLVAGLGLVAGSCDQAGSEKVAPDQAKRQIRSALDGLSENLKTLEDGAFSKAVKSFLGLQGGKVTSGDWVARLVREFDTVFEASKRRFQFEASTGEYVWESDRQQWADVGEADGMILRFPAAEAASSNNATLELAQYSDTELTVGGKMIYPPTAANGSITVGESVVFSVSLNGASYIADDGLDRPVPRSFAMEVLTAPHTHTLTLNENSSTNYDFSYKLIDGRRFVAGLSVEVELATDDYSELDSTDVETLSGTLRIGPDLTVAYTIDTGTLATLDDPSESKINDRIDATVKYQGQQIATLRYDPDAGQVEVVYPDGSVDPAAEFYGSFLDEMETVWVAYLGSSGFSGLAPGDAGLGVLDPVLGR